MLDTIRKRSIESGARLISVYIVGVMFSLRYLLTIVVVPTTLKKRLVESYGIGLSGVGLVLPHYSIGKNRLTIRI